MPREPQASSARPKAPRKPSPSPPPREGGKGKGGKGKGGKSKGKVAPECTAVFIGLPSTATTSALTALISSASSHLGLFPESSVLDGPADGMTLIQDRSDKSGSTKIAYVNFDTATAAAGAASSFRSEEFRETLKTSSSPYQDTHVVLKKDVTREMFGMSPAQWSEKEQADRKAAAKPAAATKPVVSPEQEAVPANPNGETVEGGSSKLSKVQSRIAQLAADHGQFQAAQLKLLYKRKFNEDLKERELGFKSAKTFLESCKHVVRISQTGNSLEVHPLTTVGTKSARINQLEDRFRMIDTNMEGTLKLSALQEALGDKLAYFMKPWLQTFQAPNFELTRTDFVTGTLRVCANMSDHEFKVEVLDKMSSCIASSKSTKLSKVKARIADLTVRHGRLLVSQLKLYYKRQFGEALDEGDFGFKSATDLLSQCTDVVNITKEPAGLVAVPYDKIRTNDGANGEDASPDLSTFKSRMTQLADDRGPFQAGLLKQMYKTEFKEDLNHRTLGFKSLKLLLDSCSDTVLTEMIDGNSLVVLPMTCHKNMKCDMTGMSPIRGPFYKKKGTDYDLCQAAFDRLDEQERTNFVKVGLPVPEYGMIVSGGSEVVQVTGLQQGPHASTMGLYQRTEQRTEHGRFVYKKSLSRDSDLQPYDHTYLFYAHGHWAISQQYDIGSNRAMMATPSCKCRFPEAIRTEGWNMDLGTVEWATHAIRVDPIHDGDVKALADIEIETLKNNTTQLTSSVGQGSKLIRISVPEAREVHDSGLNNSFEPLENRITGIYRREEELLHDDRAVYKCKCADQNSHVYLWFDDVGCKWRISPSVGRLADGRHVIQSLFTITSATSIPEAIPVTVQNYKNVKIEALNDSAAEDLRSQIDLSEVSHAIPVINVGFPPQLSWALNLESLPEGCLSPISHLTESGNTLVAINQFQSGGIDNSTPVTQAPKALACFEITNSRTWKMKRVATGLGALSACSQLLEQSKKFVYLVVSGQQPEMAKPPFDRMDMVVATVDRDTANSDSLVKLVHLKGVQAIEYSVRSDKTMRVSVYYIGVPPNVRAIAAGQLRKIKGGATNQAVVTGGSIDLYTANSEGTQLQLNFYSTARISRMQENHSEAHDSGFLTIQIANQELEAIESGVVDEADDRILTTVLAREMRGQGWVPLSQLFSICDQSEVSVSIDRLKGVLATNTSLFALNRSTKQGLMASLVEEADRIRDISTQAEKALAQEKMLSEIGNLREEHADVLVLLEEKLGEVSLLLEEKLADGLGEDHDCEKVQLEAQAETLKNEIAAEKHAKQQAEQDMKAQLEAEMKEIELERQRKIEEGIRATKTIISVIDDEPSVFHTAIHEGDPTETRGEKQANWVRLCRLIYDVGLGLTRDVFRRKWDQDHMGCNHQVDADKLCSIGCRWIDSDLCGHLLLQELKATVPDKRKGSWMQYHNLNKAAAIAFQSGECTEWDITLCSQLLLFTPPTLSFMKKSAEYNALDRLRIIRNALAHTSTMQVESSDFEEQWNQAVAAMQVLYDFMGDTPPSSVLDGIKSGSVASNDEEEAARYRQKLMKKRITNRVRELRKKGRITDSVVEHMLMDFRTALEEEPEEEPDVVEEQDAAEIRAVLDLTCLESQPEFEGSLKSGDAVQKKFGHRPELDKGEEAVLLLPGGIEPGGYFKMIRKLGAGGQGDVYKAKPCQGGDDVAIKFCASGRRDGREAILMQKLEHENIVRVIDSGRDDMKMVYIVMELIEGRTLSDELRRKGKISWGDAQKIICDMLTGMAHVHNERITHRDIKPENLMLTQDGTLKIVDFGLSKQDDAGMTVTQIGTVMGTMQYMSPEQIKGETKSIDQRTDIWALGIVIFEMLVGYRPFDPDCPPTLKKLLLKSGLSKDLVGKARDKESLLSLAEEQSIAVPNHNSHSYRNKLTHNIEQADLRPCEADMQQCGLPRNLRLLISHALSSKVSKRQRDAGRMLNEFEEICEEPDIEPQPSEATQGWSQWGVDQVCHFISSLGFKAEEFRDNGINGQMLAELSDEDLISELGLKKLQVRRVRMEMESCTSGVSDNSSASEASPTTSTTAANDVDTTTQEDLNEMEYPDLRRLLLSKGASKHDTDLQYGKDYLLGLAKQMGIY